MAVSPAFPAYMHCMVKDSYAGQEKKGVKSLSLLVDFTKIQ